MDPQRLAFWVELIVERCGFPSSQRLANQFASASFSEFCDCGCNSFADSVPNDGTVAPIAVPNGGAGAIFESSFRLEPSGQSLEIILFADAPGNLSYVEIDCNANSEAVPEEIAIVGAPYHVHVSEAVAL